MDLSLNGGVRKTSLIGKFRTYFIDIVMWPVGEHNENTKLLYF